MKCTIREEIHMKHPSFQAKRKVPLKLRLFLQFYAFLLLPVTIIGFGGMQWASNAVLTNAKTAYASVMQNLGSRIEEYTNDLDDITTIFMKTSLLERLAYMRGDSIDYSRISASDLRNFSQELIFQAASNRLYDDVILLFPKKNSIISTMGTWQLDWFLQDEFRPLNHTTEEVLSYIDTNIAVPNLQVVTYGAPREGTAFFRRAITSASDQTLMSVIYFVKNQTWDNYLSDLVLYDGTCAGLFMANNTPVRTLCGPSATAADQSLLLQPFADSTVRGSVTYEAMTWESDDGLLSLRALVPRNAIYDGVHRVKVFIYAMMALVAVLGAALSWGLARQNFKPFESLFHVFGAFFKMDESPSSSDMVAVEKQLLDVLNEQRSLKQSVRENRELLQYAALSHLLDGDGPYLALAHQSPLTVLGIRMPYASFRVLCAYGVTDEDRLRATVQALRGNDAMLCYPLARQGLTFLIVNYQSEDILQQLLTAVAPLCVALTVSAACDHPSGLPGAYQEAVATLHNRPLSDQQNVFYYEETIPAETVRYSAEEEHRLLGTIRAGDETECMRILDEVLAHNRTVAMLSKLVTAIELTVYKADNVQGDLAAMLRGCTAPESLSGQEQVDYIRQIISSAAGYYRASAVTTKSALTEKLTLFIDENLCNEQLSLSMTAQHFSLSNAYLSRYFKEHFGVGYLEYVNRKRVILASELLHKGCSVHDVALQCGFSNDASLRRVFKRYEGMVPSAVALKAAEEQKNDAVQV